MSQTFNYTSIEQPLTSEGVLHVAQGFQTAPIASLDLFSERGNINLDTFEVADVDGRQYLLQRINDEVFRDPRRVMAAMGQYAQVQRSYLATAGRSDVTWDPIELIPSLDGELYQFYESGPMRGVWRLMAKIPNAVCFKSLGDVPADRRLAIAEEVGRGLAFNADTVADMSIKDLRTSLPGYRDTEGYFRQFRAIVEGTQTESDAERFLPDDEEVRHATAHLYRLACTHSEHRARMREPEVVSWVRLVQESEPFALVLQQRVRDGVVRQTAIHGDTKIENFLFDAQTLKVKGLVDLDTIMPYTWLADWGDMMRSLVNVAGEREPDPERVQVDRDVYEAVTRGFLATAQAATAEEVALMADAVAVIAVELGTRFLADFLRGDNYFQLAAGDPHDLNLIRTRTQLTLFRRLMEIKPWAEDVVSRHQAMRSPVGG